MALELVLDGEGAMWNWRSNPGAQCSLPVLFPRRLKVQRLDGHHLDGGSRLRRHENYRRNLLHLAIMPEKQPKRPNNNAKALENWESEGGAPASDDRSTKRKRPRVLNQITKVRPLADRKQKPKGT